MSQHNVTIEVAGRRLKIACPQGQESALLQAANELNSRLETDKSNVKVIKTAEQAMLMASLNLANDYLEQQQAFKAEKQQLESKIDLLQQTIEQAVHRQEKQA
ncbi:cell division protein ZapA [Thalassotalea sp. 1_MG-2023]|uniref:cell division protein ZapA n=1 Tax=Thalassotalea sp. 1_MG-2023 TaxID=3062680 RepID=UPI0026E40421|nr:cell division protein ZapA [Thalassotalea sp. 1_MG-2023]MDO6426794.1 cell division protein ZapA [Thalassotalea sp. 1_MG-2023]